MRRIYGTAITLVWLMFVFPGLHSCSNSGGYEARIEAEVDRIRIVDTHEHLSHEYMMLERKAHAPLDFSILFDLYIFDDMASVGYTKAIQEKIRDVSIPVRERWMILEPYWKKVETTSYARMVKIMARDIYGVDEINENTVEELSKRINDAYQPGWYKTVLKDKSQIDISVLDFNLMDVNEDFFVHVQRFEEFVLVYSAPQIQSVCERYGKESHSLADFEAALDDAFAKGLEKGMVAIKNGMAYARTLDYMDPDREAATRVFDRMIRSTDSLSFEEAKPLQDYMWHQIAQKAEKNHLPIQVHTGLQAWGRNDVRMSDPLLLIRQFNLYPDTKFILFHGSYPYGGALSVLAKNYPNVYIDMCWMYLISPSYSERYLYEWLETVPASKIMAFGGDHFYVEGAYAHQVIAREVIAKVLIRKVQEGHFSEEQAINVARMILRNNAIEILKLDLPI
ncbi:MAG: amidohydrolase family protein [Bacteroidota bacterium]